MTESTSNPPTVDVGEIAAEGLRLWCARQALDQAQKRLEFQSASMDSLTSRAGQTIGWSVTLSCALLALTINQKLPCTMLSVCLFSGLTAACAAMVLRPRQWVPPTQMPDWFLHTALRNELAVVEQQALSFQSGIQENRGQLTVCSRWLVCSWASFAAIPAVGALAHIITGR
ncbi:hypothetical protein [Acetobacter papayae]|uniref:hypothetical protein n=1 Tax=Acetobacter papayae TaxID=1076592 RepID=UPI0039E7FEC5